MTGVLVMPTFGKMTLYAAGAVLRLTGSPSWTLSSGLGWNGSSASNA